MNNSSEILRLENEIKNLKIQNEEYTERINGLNIVLMEAKRCKEEYDKVFDMFLNIEIRNSDCTFAYLDKINKEINGFKTDFLKYIDNVIKDVEDKITKINTSITTNQNIINIFSSKIVLLKKADNGGLYV